MILTILNEAIFSAGVIMLIIYYIKQMRAKQDKKVKRPAGIGDSVMKSAGIGFASSCVTSLVLVIFAFIVGFENLIDESHGFGMIQLANFGAILTTFIGAGIFCLVLSIMLSFYMKKCTLVGYKLNINETIWISLLLVADIFFGLTIGAYINWLFIG